MIFLVLLTKLSPYGYKIPTDFFFQVRKSETTKIFFNREGNREGSFYNHAIILFENNSHVFVTLKRRRLHKNVNAGSGMTRISNVKTSIGTEGPVSYFF